MAKKKEQKIKVTLTGSLIHQLPAHKKTAEALGLRKIGQSREFTATPQLLGMVEKVKHLVSCVEL